MMTAAEKKAFIFDEPGYFMGNIAPVIFQGKKAWLYRDGRLVIDVPYDFLIRCDDGNFVARNYDNRKYGILSPEGEVIIPLIYDDISFNGFEHGLCWAEIKGFNGFINPSGETVIPFRYQGLSNFSEEGYAWAMLNSMEGIIDREGNEIIPFLFYDINTTFEDGWLGIATADYALRYGKPKKSCFIYNEIPGGFYLSFKHKKSNFINPKREMLLSEWADNVIYFRENRAWAVYKNRYDLIDTQGMVLHQARYQDAGPFYNGLAYVQTKGKYGFIDPYGQFVIAPQFTEVDDFQDAYLPVKRKSKWGLINREGQTIIDFKYDHIGFENDNFIEIKQNDQFSIINIKGESLTDTSFDRIGYYNDTLVAVEKNGLIGFIDPQTGEMRIPPRYQSGNSRLFQFYWTVFDKNFRAEYACVCLDGKWGFIDEQGKPLPVKKDTPKTKLKTSTSEN
jgi:hypothetical protein